MIAAGVVTGVEEQRINIQTSYLLELYDEIEEQKRQLVLYRDLVESLGFDPDEVIEP